MKSIFHRISTFVAALFVLGILSLLTACTSSDVVGSGLSNQLSKSSAKNLTVVYNNAIQSWDTNKKSTLSAEGTSVVLNLTVSAKASLSKGNTVLVLNSNNSIDQTLNVPSETVYIVTAEDGSINKYTINITQKTNSSKAINSFIFTTALNPGLTEDAKGTVNENTTPKTVTVNVPFGTDVSRLKPTITHSGRSVGGVSPANDSDVNFTTAQIYTVTASDNSSQEYLVTVTVLAQVTYKVSFISDNATVSEQTVSQGGKATRPASVNKSGYGFINWYTDTTYTTVFDFNTTITANTTVYAKWEALNLQKVVTLGTIPNASDLAKYDAMTQAVLKPYTAGAAVSAVYVTVNGAGTKDGSSWANALAGDGGGLKTKIDGIIDASATKVYLVLVAAGTYKQGAEMSMRNNVAIVGGFASAGSWTRGATDTTILHGNDSYRVLSSSQLNNTALLYGVNVEHGKETGALGGGGMFNYQSSPTITQVTFANNSATFSGAGMYNLSSSPILTQVTFANNSATSCAGLDNFGGSPTLMQVTFANNSATNLGGGMCNGLSTTTLVQVTFANNSAPRGGGMSIDSNGGAGPIIVNSVFWGNTATTGAQMYINNDSTYTENLSLYSSVVQGGWGSTTPTSGTALKSLSGGGIVSDSSANMVIKHAGVVTTDPLLSTALANNGGSVQTRALGVGSSAINAGLYIKKSGSTFYYSANNSTWFSDPALTAATAATPPTDAVEITATDARGYARVGVPDIGAYEYGATAP